MPLSVLASRLQLIASCIVISAAIGGVYTLLANTLPEGGQPLEPWAVPRGMLTGAVISGLLVSLEIFLLDGAGDGALAAPLRRLPFSALVTIKMLVYLAVILFSLTPGSGRIGPSAAGYPVLARSILRLRLHVQHQSTDGPERAAQFRHRPLP
ncbi:MAG: hypothetical protein JO223_22805 [Hyphomicrobiales bacterium]|nr:hypothetical protein [Hyphomicrobiales bacterium]